MAGKRKRSMMLKVPLIIALSSILVLSASGCRGGGGEIKRVGFYLKLKVFDRTSSSRFAPSPNFTVRAKAIKAWTPDLKKDFNQNLIGPLKFNRKESIEIYPYGITGEKHVVDFVVTETMKKESERDAITVEIQDTKIVVSGTPIEGSPVEFTRKIEKETGKKPKKK